MSRINRLEVGLVVLIVLVCAVFIRWSYIPSFYDRHVEVSEEKYDFDVGDPGPWFSAWSIGDGQAYVLIALDPTGGKLADEVSEAGYRFSRASFGWAGWAVSLGQDHLVPYSLALVGFLSVIGSLVAAVMLRPRLGPMAWLIVLNPALYIGFAGDTSEPLGILLLVTGLATGSWVAGALLGVTQPTFLVAAWGRWKVVVGGFMAAAVLALYGVIVFGPAAMLPDGGRIAFPLTAYLDHVSWWGWLLAGVAAITIGAGVRARDWSWVIAGLFVLCFGDDVLRDPVNAWRVAGFLPVLWAFGTNYEANVNARLRSSGANVAADPTQPTTIA